ncbi:hypothetical protein HHK36_010258 [Tetracentron sinense]|uniref:RRM domain-containing protein n=1 Tax=Tetracentron sinense TaxID=13715 RepID=A0A834ZCG9_TETSI|nr:hypothetical protein HHK36_010258 [Tetracentron sinense]
MESAEVEYRCFVGGLAWTTDDQSLERAFSSFGEIINSQVRSCICRGCIGSIRLW